MAFQPPRISKRNSLPTLSKGKKTLYLKRFLEQDNSPEIVFSQLFWKQRNFLQKKEHKIRYQKFLNKNFIFHSPEFC